jgi:transcriptional regulator with XRE-family HTH domain
MPINEVIMSKAKKIKATVKEPSEFAKFVTRYRKINNLSQRDLAAKLDLSNSFVAYIENDKFDLPIAFFAHLWPHLDAGERSHVTSLFREAIVIALESGGKDKGA